MSANTQTATDNNKRQRKPATPPTKLEAVSKIGKILKTFSAADQKAILDFVAAG